MGFTVAYMQIIQQQLYTPTCYGKIGPVFFIVYRRAYQELQVTHPLARVQTKVGSNVNCCALALGLVLR